VPACQGGPVVGSGVDGTGGGVVEGATVTVAVVRSRTEAELMVGLFRSNGLTAAVATDDAGGQEPQLQLQGVRVRVAPSDDATARQILADVHAGRYADDDDAADDAADD
jgi:hypothetical protein